MRLAAVLVLLVSEFNVGPRLRFLPLGLGDRALQVGQGPGRETPSPVPVAKPEEFHAMGIWVVHRQLRTFVRLVVPGHSLASRPPPEPNGHRRLALAEGGDAFPGLEGVHGAGAGIVGRMAV